MQQKIVLQIPTPCHENWNNMDTTTQNQPGKFCGSCQKTVIDFTNMSDAQVLGYFSSNKSNTCGRFENDQLNRVLATPPPPKKSWYKWMMAALVSGFIFSNKAKAQTKGKVGEMQTCQTKPQLMGDTIKNQQIVLGGISSLQIAEQKIKYVVQGVVKDENGNPIASASVIIKDSKLGTATDKDGKFSISYDFKNANPTLKVSSVGYNFIERAINPNEIEKLEILKNELHMIIKPIIFSRINEVFAGEVVVITSKPKKINKVIDTLRNSLPAIAAPIKDKLIIAPNPAKAGTSINLTFGKAGEYQVQLFNLQSIMLYNQKVTVAMDGAKAPFNLPASIAKGEYFITATNQQIKTQLTGKLIVQ